jgi:hypothetical protein
VERALFTIYCEMRLMDRLAGDKQLEDETIAAMRRMGVAVTLSR